MASKKVSSKKPKTQSGQSYADRFKKSENKAWSKAYAHMMKYDPDRYAGPKGASLFAKEYKQNAGLGDVTAKASVASFRRATSGDAGAKRTAGRARTVRKGKK